MIDFKDLKLETKVETTKVKVNDTTELEVRAYLPTIEKVALLEYVVNNAIDEATGRFSPIRVELFFSLAVLHWYADMIFGDDVPALDAYDALETNGVLDAVVSAIPETEYNFVSELINTTVKDIADYNCSLAGMVRAVSQNADDIQAQVEELSKKIQNKEGLELLSDIKNVVGTD